MGLLKAKIQFYNSMATMYEAGLPLSKALRQRHSAPLGKAAAEISIGIEKGGSTMSAEMALRPWLFSGLECQLARAGEETGKLDVIFKSLAGWFELQSRLKGRIIADMAYPALLFHFAAFMIPCISFLIGRNSAMGTAIQILLFLCPPYLLLFLFLIFNRIKHRFNVDIPPALSGIILHAPVIGTLVRKMDYARFFSVFGLTTGAGMGMDSSIRLAADACRNGWIRDSMLKTAEKIRIEGCSFTKAFSMFIFPADRDSIAVSIMETGELSGKIPDIAKRMADTYQYETEEAMKLVASIVPKAVYIIIVIYMAFTIISFWSQLFSQINNQFQQ